MRQTVGTIPKVTETGVLRNRRGILLGNSATPQTKTLTPTLWSLLNSIDGNATQHPHKHNSVALDLAVDGGNGGLVYSLLGKELDANGSIVDSIKVPWQSGGVFVTPPGWWHSHHNEGDRTAWVLPIQDAGLYTHQRTLDIRFVEDEAERLQKGINRGATLDIGKEQQGESQEVVKAGARPLVAGTLLFGHSH
jgi:gentisate 1,2-dioxygenase